MAGKPVKILSVKPDQQPHRIVILLDSSGSMFGDAMGHKWKMARFVAAHIARANLPNTSLALLVFSEKVNEQIDFSQGNSAVVRRLLEIEADTDFAKKQVRGETALWDVLLIALQWLRDPGYVNSVYIITDGGDNKSRNRLRHVRDDLVSSGVRLYFTLLSSERPMQDEQFGQTEVADLAEASGGLVLGPLGGQPFGRPSYNPTKDELRGVAIGLNELYSVMTRNDLIEIELPQTLKKWSKWSLGVSSEQKALHKNWLVVYPQELAPCVAAPSSP